MLDADAGEGAAGGRDRAFLLAVESVSEVSLSGFLSVDVASLRALQIFQARPQDTLAMPPELCVAACRMRMLHGTRSITYVVSVSEGLLGCSYCGPLQAGPHLQGSPCMLLIFPIGGLQAELTSGHWKQ